jgi:hypothetical protein
MVDNAMEEMDEQRVEAVAGDRTGLLIIRAWLEKGSAEPLRAQIRISANVSAGIERTIELCRVEQVCATVKEWLTDMLSHANIEPGADPPGVPSESKPGAG